MKSLRALTMAGLVCLATDTALASGPMVKADIDGPVAEVAIYRVKNPDQFPAMMASVMDMVGEMPGLRDGVHMRSLKHPDLFADVNIWDSLEEAAAAAKRVETEARFKPFMERIVEIKLFGHFQPGTDGAELRKFLAEDAAIEMAVYSVKDPALQGEPRQRVYAELAATEAFHGGMPLVPAKAGDPYIDFIAWTSEKEAMETANAMMAKEAHKPFFGNADVLSMFEFFKIYDTDGFDG